MNQVIDSDRGLGTAYERYCFYQLLDAWAKRFAVKTVLEGPLDGMAGVPGVHGAGLASQGLDVTSIVTSPEQQAITRGVYESVAAGKSFRVEVGSAADVESLPNADLVIVYHAFGMVDDWRDYLQKMSAHAAKALVVAVCNPDNWGVSVIRFIGKLRGIRGLDAPESWRTDVLAPALWELGRVKDHAFFDCPWWPDLQVSPGQSLKDRAKQLAVKKKDAVTFTAGADGSKLAEKFVYGPGRWPYFGGPGWHEELLPAMLMHPSFEAAPASLRARAAHLHAFVVDVSPRTPQQRRKLQLAADAAR